jgi:glucoamylase
MLQSYWNSNGNYLIANFANDGRTGKDANTILGTIHT